MSSCKICCNATTTAPPTLLPLPLHHLLVILPVATALCGQFVENFESSCCCAKCTVTAAATPSPLHLDTVAVDFVAMQVIVAPRDEFDCCVTFFILVLAIDLILMLMRKMHSNSCCNIVATVR